ncbi:YihY family inner membrane protein [Altererythrobacter aurantiacus]|uniref:YihY family inner membrane protein n=1 Tax=Parapontixanthobacter aurantiacus TaxID=1463599 RepID=A0A844ZGP1_9SPHN|nr:YihY/virulence factor BrkB family protein [Parapontixanthobacter aurantiacus]MXO86543.1 YihY family inner membrane protein [Parapontixanthobacter aurantiacus]
MHDNDQPSASETQFNPSPTPDQDTSSLIEAPGARAKSPWSMPRKAWVQVFKRVWAMIGFHNLNLLAAGVAFFTFLAITPLLAATVMTYGLVGDIETVQSQMQTVSELLPADAASIVEEQLLAVVSTSAGVKGVSLALALSFAIYGAMRAANGMLAALNVIYEEHESRNILQTSLQALWLTLAAIGIALTGVLTSTVFAWLQTASSDVLGPTADRLVSVLTWAVAFLLASIGFAMIMRFGPDRRAARWLWLTPGAVMATTLFVLISFGFSGYVAYISDYSATYGSLAAIVVFLMWLFLSAYSVLLGAVVNAEIERQTLEDSTVGPERPLGERGAVMADSTLAKGHSLELQEKRRRQGAERLARKSSQ